MLQLCIKKLKLEGAKVENVIAQASIEPFSVQEVAENVAYVLLNVFRKSLYYKKI